MSWVNDLCFKPPVLFRAVCFVLPIPASPVYKLGQGYRSPYFFIRLEFIRKRLHEAPEVAFFFATMPTGETVNVAGTQAHINSILIL